MLDEKNVHEVYTNLYNAKEKYAEASEKFINLKFTLNVLKAEATQNGEIDGKNADAREASARSLLKENYDALDKAEIEERKMRHSLDLANLEVERVKTLLRLQEVLK